MKLSVASGGCVDRLNHVSALERQTIPSLRASLKSFHERYLECVDGSYLEIVDVSSCEAAKSGVFRREMPEYIQFKSLASENMELTVESGIIEIRSLLSKTA